MQHLVQEHMGTHGWETPNERLGSCSYLANSLSPHPISSEGRKKVYFPSIFWSSFLIVHYFHTLLTSGGFLSHDLPLSDPCLFPNICYKTEKSLKYPSSVISVLLQCMPSSSSQTPATFSSIRCVMDCVEPYPLIFQEQNGASKADDIFGAYTARSLHSGEITHPRSDR